MRRPINWLVFALSLGFLFAGRVLQQPQPAPVVIERPRFDSQMAAAQPAGLRRHADLEFGYVEQDR
jgi:hypothetical protein